MAERRGSGRARGGKETSRKGGPPLPYVPFFDPARKNRFQGLRMVRQRKLKTTVREGFSSIGDLLRFFWEEPGTLRWGGQVHQAISKGEGKKKSLWRKESNQRRPEDEAA